jgi:hypothetical protein
MRARSGRHSRFLSFALVAASLLSACGAPVSPTCSGECNTSGFVGYDVAPTVVATVTPLVCFGSVSITTPGTQSFPTCSGAWATPEPDGGYTVPVNVSFAFGAFVSNPRAKGRTLTYDLTLSGACAKHSSPHHISFDEHERPSMGGFSESVFSFPPDVCTFHFIGTETGGNLSAPTILDRDVEVRIGQN